MKKKRIGIFDSCAVESGISRYVRVLLDGIDRDEFDVIVFARGEHYTGTRHARIIQVRVDRPQTSEPALASSQSPMWGAMRAGWRSLSPAPINLLAGFGRETRRLVALFRRYPVDLLHVQLVGADEAPPAAKLAGIRRVMGTLHIDSSQSSAGRWPIETMTNHCLHRAIAVSRSTAKDWIRRTGLPARFVTTIPNGVDVDHYRYRQNASRARVSLDLPAPPHRIIAAIGRLSEQKGFTFLLDAFSRLSGRFPELTLVIAGDGPLEATLREQAQAEGISSRVRFLGAIADVRPVLEAADIFVLPSLWEALPYALLEAMSMGVPPVATNVAGVPEVIEAGRSGLLVPPGDALALANAIEQLLSQADLRASVGEQARERIKNHFDQSEMLARTIDIYRRMTLQFKGVK